MLFYNLYLKLLITNVCIFSSQIFRYKIEMIFIDKHNNLLLNNFNMAALVLHMLKICLFLFCVKNIFDTLVVTYKLI